MGLADNAYDDGTLLDGFLCILDLEDTALRGAVEALEQVHESLGLAAIVQSDGIVVVVVSEHGGG